MKRFPLVFGISYLAKRAGMDRVAMRRLLKQTRIGELIKQGRKTRITLSDLRELAPKIYDSLMLRDAMYGAEDEAA